MLFCASSCNKGKFQESIIENDKKDTKKNIATEEKKISTIDTVDFNKRLLAFPITTPLDFGP